MVSLLPLLLFSAAAATEQDGQYDLPDAGVRLVLPRWHMSRWSDWDFRGRTEDGGVLVAAWYTPFQTTLSADNAGGFRDSWKAKLEEEERATNVSFTHSDMTTIAERPTLRGTATLELPGGQRAVFEAAAFSTEGRTMHVATYAASANARRAATSLDSILRELSVTRPPQALPESGKLEHELFTLTLPRDWRAPLKSEEFDAGGLYSRTGAKDTAKCASAVRPVAPGVTDLIIACPDGPALTIVDEYSFADEAMIFRSALFGKAAESLAPASPVTTPSGMAILQKANDGLYVAGLPYREGTLLTWVAGESSRDAELARAANEVAATWTLAADAKSEHSFGAVVAHTLAYRPTHPAVLLAVAVMVGLLGLFAKLIFSRPRMELPPTY